MKELQDLLYHKLKDTPFRVWHYYALLAVVYVAFPLLPREWLESTNVMLVLFAIVIGASLVSQAVGRSLSRAKGIDSVLIARYFALIPWVISFVTTSVALQLGQLTGLIRDLYQVFFWMALGLSLFHILGIVIHYKKRTHTVRNVNKEDLFQ